MKLFGRRLEVIIGADDESITLKAPLQISLTSVKDIKTGEKDYANINIYNLKKGTRDKLNGKYKKVKILGGYGEKLDLIFFGEIIASTHKQQGTNWLTTLECGDGIEVLDQAIINKTYEKGFKMADIVKDFASLNDISIESMIGIDESFALPRGKAFTGSMKDNLDQLGNSAGFDWSMQDGKLVVVQRGKSRQETAVVISASSGMVGSPEWINSGADAQKLENADGLKFKVVSLVIPSLKPADKIIVKSESLKGRIGSFQFDTKREPFNSVFKVEKVQHDLDNRQGNFTTTIECVSMEGL